MAYISLRDFVPTGGFRTPGEIAEAWRKKFDEGTLSHECFKSVWKWNVPRHYKLENTVEAIPKVITDEDDLNENIYGPMEEFMFTKNKMEALKDLKKIETPLTTCGHVFRFGESTYTCRDCAMDSTCVLCVDCFKCSVHRFHRYKMGSSNGGGCCDCGDLEAWKIDPWCETHKQNAEEAKQKELQTSEPQASDINQIFAILDTLDHSLVKRVEAVFGSACRYAFDILTYYNYQIVPEGVNATTSIMPELVEEGLAPSNLYCTLLYNDESHTYEQVTSAVTRVTQCCQKTAMELVTQVDRDGRALIKYGDFQSAFQVHDEVQRYLTRFGHAPLKTLILHSTAIIHQYFALDLLAWVEKMVKSNKALRLIFSKVVMKPPKHSILEGVMLRDSRMWKFARLQWNRLFFNGLLLEYDTKRAFAKVLTSNYGLIMKDFMNDDHDHSYSIASLSVQVYTAPSLALYLIEHDDVLYNLLNTFYSECLRLNNVAARVSDSEMKLILGRNPNAQQFKRSHFVLYDLRYLLSCKPTTWTNVLRRSFLHGFSMFLKVLTMMQGMEPFARCLYEHAEYEQDWESAFYLHCKMAFVICLMHEWCGEDRVVLIKAYRAVLKKLEDNPLPGTDGPMKVCTVAGRSYECLQYDVSRKHVSIHIPLTRLLAALHLHLQKFNMDFNSEDLQYDTRPRIDQILEPVLRQQVLIAQVHANMWRRNGMNLPNQLQWYANSKCRNEMLDCDIVMLQTVATIMTPDEFIITLLNRFNLINWAQDDYVHEQQGPEDDSLRQVITLGEELLGLLITIIGERYKPGIGQLAPEDCLSHEIVQQLCIKSMTHSELNQALHKDFNHETGLENVVESVADLKEQPQGKKLYELKPERAKEFNLFFYHYTREDRSKAEENRRKQSKLNKELECCPPPLPPAFTAAYAKVLDLLQCDVMFSIIENVINRTTNLRNSCFSELQLQEALYLMGFALLEEEAQIKSAKSTIPPDEVKMQFSTQAEKRNIFPELLDTLLKCPRVEAQGQIPLITWVLGKYRQVLQLRNQSGDDSMTDTGELSKMLNTTEDEEAARKAKESRSEWVARHRARTLQQMQAMQANFMKENANFLAVVEAEMKEENPCAEPEVEIPFFGPPVALGINRSHPAPMETRFTCILCQATESLHTPVFRHMLMASFIQESTVLCRSHKKPRRLTTVEEDATDIRNPCAAEQQLSLKNNLGPAPHVTSCGHKMHADCFNKYYESAVQRESRRSFRRLIPPFDIDREEYMCPLCNNLSNSTLPIMPPLDAYMTSSEGELKVDITLDEWFKMLVKLYFSMETSDHNSLMDEVSKSMTPETWEKCKHLFFNQKQIPFSKLGVTIKLDKATVNFVKRFSKSVYNVATSLNPHVTPPYNPYYPGYLWQACAYTIHAMEWLQREPGKALLGQFTTRQEETLRALILTSALDQVNIPHATLREYTCELLRILIHPDDLTSSCILEWDPLSLIVSLTMVIPSIFAYQKHFCLPTCSTKELHTLHIVLLIHMTSLMLGMKWDEMPMEIDEGMPPELGHVKPDGYEAVMLLRFICKTAHLPAPPMGLTASYFWNRLTADCIPFLRCCAIFYRYLSGVAMPEALTQPGGDTFVELCSFLGLPTTCEGLLGHEVVQEMVARWCTHRDLRTILDSEEYIRGPVKVKYLAPLPKDFMDLINSVSDFKCELTGEESRNPTMCLACGEIVCLQSYCCQARVNSLTMGPSMYHSYWCSAGIGLFLRIRECETLVLNTFSRGCFMAPPYVDKYGETDEGLRRGNPLYLCERRYKDLHTQWLSHTLPQAIGRSHDDMSHRHLIYQWRVL